MPRAFLPGELPDPVGVISAICEQSCSGLQFRRENRNPPIVVCLTRRDGKVCWQTSGVHGRRKSCWSVRLVNHRMRSPLATRLAKPASATDGESTIERETLAKRSGGIPRGMARQGQPLRPRREGWCSLPQGLRTFYAAVRTAGRCLQGHTARCS